MLSTGKLINKKLLIIFASVLTLITATTRADNLSDIYKLAKSHDPEIRAAYADYYAAREQLPQSRSALLPSISASASESDTTRNSNTAQALFNTGEQESSSSSWSIDLNQSIYVHEEWVALRQARASVGQAKADYDNAQLDLILRVAQAYFDVLAAMDTLDFAEAEKKSVAQQLEQTRQRYDVGLIAITDVKESQASYDLAVAQEIQASNTLATNREALRAITNRYPDNLSALDEQMPLISPAPDNINQWVDTAMKLNFTLISTRYAYEIAQKEVARIRAGHYPSLSLSARKSNSEDDNSSFGGGPSEQDSTSVSIQLSVPLFQGGYVSSRVKEAVFRENSSKENLESTKRLVVQQTRNHYQTVIADISRVAALKQALASTQAAYEATNAGFEVGTRNSAEVLLALRDTFRARRDYSQARYDYILNSLRLKQSAGILNKQDIDAINKWLK